MLVVSKQLLIHVFFLLCGRNVECGHRTLWPEWGSLLHVSSCCPSPFICLWDVAGGHFRIQFVKGRKSKVSADIVKIINGRKSWTWRENWQVVSVTIWRHDILSLWPNAVLSRVTCCRRVSVTLEVSPAPTPDTSSCKTNTVTTNTQETCFDQEFSFKNVHYNRFQVIVERTHLSCSLLMSVCSLLRYSVSSSEWPSTTRLWARSLKILPTWTRMQTSWFLLNLISTWPRLLCRWGLFRTFSVGGEDENCTFLLWYNNTDSTVAWDCCNF